MGPYGWQDATVWHPTWSLLKIYVTAHTLNKGHTCDVDIPLFTNNWIQSNNFTIVTQTPESTIVNKWPYLLLSRLNILTISKFVLSGIGIIVEPHW